MNKIPVTFDYDGKQISGHFSEISGAGTDGGRWDLMVNKFYWGSLQKTGDTWHFNEQKPAVAHLVDHFAAIVIAWYQ